MSQDQKIPARANSLPYLLEIGSEEIPARFIPGALADLERLLKSELEQAHLQFDEIRFFATPRRKAALIDGLDARQPDRNQEIKGPPVSVAFNDAGEPTPAALGFARKVGLDLADCDRGEDKRGEFLLAKVTETGRPAAEVLSEIIPRIILAVPYRKTMRWGEHDLEYPRPLQWIVSLLGEDVVPVQVDYLVAGKASRGHRTLAEDREVEIATPADYLKAMGEAGVMVDQGERRQVINDGVQKILADYDPVAQLVVDEDLLTEVVYLCEYPTPFLGSYSEQYAVLPGEVITTALKSHQRYFSVGKTTGDGLMPRFVAVRDGGADHLANVVRGNERVLHARLADALFYWDFDQQKTPDERTEMLASVTWIEGFGSVRDKIARMESLVQWLWDHGLGDGGAVPEDLNRAARICKSDLVSEMIKDGKEFTKLEGFIGARYAALAGENEQVCRTIERHYYPRSATGEMPGDEHAVILSIADRLDTIAGCWLAGFVPTGAKDPYALRRHVLAILRMLLDGEVRLDLAGALDHALRGLADLSPERDLAADLVEVSEFVRTRLDRYFAENLNANPEVVRAVLPARWRDPVDALAWVKALDQYREQDDFQLLATGFKRCRNILKGEILAVGDLEACRDRWLAGGQGCAGEDFAALPEAREQELRAQVAAAAPDLVAAEKSRNYDRIFATLSGMGPSIDLFFDEVRVNAEEKDLKYLRHAFLREIHGLFAQYADFTAVAPSDAS